MATRKHGAPMLKTAIHMSDKGVKTTLNLSVPFNGHADDRRAVWKATMKAMDERHKYKKHTVQRIEVKHDR